MRAIILADNNDLDLKPLTNMVPFPLLPVAGKTILIHILEQLHRSGIRSALVVSRSLHRELEVAIDTGPLLGMEVQFRNELPDLRRINDETLLLGTNLLVDHNWEEVIRIRKASCNKKIISLMTTSSVVVGFLLPANITELIPNVWGDFSETINDSVSIGLPKILKIDSLASYQKANFELLNGTFRHFFPAGRSHDSCHYISPKVHLTTDSLQGHHSFIGSHSRVDNKAKLQGNVVIGKDVFIDKGAEISDSVILDSTYIGAMTSCHNAIISGNLLIKVDSGVSITIDDPMIISALH